MRSRFLLLVAASWLGGCATALNEGSTTGDGAVAHDASMNDGGTDGTTLDAHDTTPIFETEGDVSGDTRIDSSVADGADSAIDTKVDSGAIDSGVDSKVVDTAPDAIVTGCGATSPKVLIYGPVGTKEQPFLPAGAIVTVATDASWRAMTTAQFATYNLLVIGEQGTPVFSPSTAPWQAAFDTRATWSPAVTGRVVVTTLDPVAHGSTISTTFLKAALSWAASGPGPGLYVGPDYGARKLDYLSSFGAWTALGQTSPDGIAGDDVHIVLPTNGAVVGSTDASLSSWVYSYHGVITGFPSPFVSVATTSAPSRHTIVARDVPCP